jgi:hypothetical protein
MLVIILYFHFYTLADHFQSIIYNFEIEHYVIV